MLIFIKLGGSLITDKHEVQHFHADVMRRAAEEIARATAARPDVRLVIGHGSGSFGHVAASKYGTAHGVSTPDQWRGFAEVSTVARRLNALVTDTLAEAGLPILGIQPSASARCVDGRLASMDTGALETALDHGLIPVVHGDVALDSVRGGTIISTETIFDYLAEHLRPQRIMLLGEVEGVYDTRGVIIPRITSETVDSFADSLGGSSGTDVTGGMNAKVRSMITLVDRIPGLDIRIFGGTTPGQLEAAITGTAEPGTLITRAPSINPNLLRTTSTLRVRGDAQEVTQELEALQTVTQVMAQRVKLDDLLRLIIAKLIEACEAERGTLYLVDAQRGELYSKILTEDSRKISEIRIKVGQGIAGYVAATGDVVNIADAYSDPRFNRKFDQITGFRTNTVLAAPLRTPDGKIIGVVQVLNNIGGPFTERDERMLLAMAAQAAISIENARLYDREIHQQLIEQDLKIARSIQKSFLPSQIPTHPRWDIFAFWSPAQEVAGDFYDFKDLGNGRWAFVVADVSGKGIPAALFMALSVTVLRFALTLDFPPAELLRNVNRSLCAVNEQSQMFATIFVGYLDLTSGLMEFASAGHNPPLLRRSTGETEYLRCPGVLAGMFDEIAFEQRRAALQVGDVLVLYTDGITEAINPREEEFGEERLEAVIAENATRPAAEIVRALIDAVSTFAGERGAFDDETVVVIKLVN